MGSWRFEPWEDDLAADWLHSLFAQTRLAERVEKTLRKQDVAEYWPEIRAAAHVITVLGDVWPPELLKPHHELAIEQLEAVKHTPEFEGDDYMASEIDAQIAVLHARLQERASEDSLDGETRIPPKSDPAKALRDVTDPDPQVRKAGAMWIGKHAYGGAHRWTEAWLADPRTTEALLPLLDDPDPEVAEQAITAIRGIMGRHYQDPRVFPGAVRLMQSDRVNTRQAAALVAMQLDGEACLDDLLRLFKDPIKSVRSNVIQETAHHCDTWSAEARARLREAALVALEDRTADVRYSGAFLLTAVGGRGDLPAIRKAKAQTKGAGWQTVFNDVIQMIRKGDEQS